jgi:hypothetical protein
MLISIPSPNQLWSGTRFAKQSFIWGRGCNDAAETIMKIYLLMLLMGAILASVHIPAKPDPRTKSLPH